MYLLQQQKPMKALKLVQTSQLMLLEHSKDWYGCYIDVLNKLNADENRKQFFAYCLNGETHNENDTLIPSDISIGKCLKKVFCENCEITIIEDLNPLRSICINIEGNNSLANKIKQYLTKSKIDMECIRCRKEHQLFESFSIISAPKYLLFYFTSSNLGKNELMFEDGFVLSTEEGDKWYQILLFINLFRGSYVITYCGGNGNIFENNICDNEEVSQHFPKFVIGFVAVITELKENGNIKTSSGSIPFGPEERQKLAMDRQCPENMTVKPKVNEIPTNTESCSAVIGMILSLSDVCNHLFEFHKSDQIAKINFDARQDITEKDAIFINDLCKMTESIKENVENIAKVPQFLKKYIEHKSNRFDIYNSFNFFLEKIHCFTKPEIELEDSRENMDRPSLYNRSQSFIDYFFHGQISIKKRCDICKNVIDEHNEPINSLLLNLTMIQNKDRITLEECLQWFLCERQNNSNDKVTCCSNPIIKETREITHSPEYLFICLNRKYANGKVDVRFVDTDDGIIIPVRNQTVLYQLCSVIDQSTDVILKIYGNMWLSITNQTVSPIHKDLLITNESCGFLFRKNNQC